MKTRNFTSMGSLHPILFFAVVYVVALLLSIFICSSLFYSFRGSSSSKIGSQEISVPMEKQAISAATVTAVAMR